MSVNFTLFEKYCFAEIYLSDLYEFCIWYEFCLKCFAVNIIRSFSCSFVQPISFAVHLAGGGQRCSEPQICMFCELFAREWFAKFIKSGAAMLRCGKLD